MILLSRKLLLSASQVIVPNAIHSFPLVSSFVNTVDSSKNMTNYGTTLSSGYAMGNGSTQYAYAYLQLPTTNVYTYSAWVSLSQIFTYYQFLFGGNTYNTSGPSEYSWFICFYGNKIAQVSTALYGTAESIDVPVHIVARVDIPNLRLVVHRNAVNIYDGTLLYGTKGVSSTDYLAICGFTGFSSTYARGSKVHSIEVFNGELTDAQIVKLYQKGML